MCQEKEYQDLLLNSIITCVSKSIDRLDFAVQRIVLLQGNYKHFYN
jgi:hypothetical protein